MNEEDWNAFAAEYYLNQREGKTTIVKDVIDYLKREDILPTEQIVDVAGGSGRYLAMAKEAKMYELIDFSSEMLKFAAKEVVNLSIENICLTKKTFLSFLENAKKYDLIFSASNPALDHPIKLEKIYRKMKKACVIIRVVYSKDDLFAPLEEQLDILEEDYIVSSEIMKLFETYLKEEEIPYKSKKFTYLLKEKITESFMKDYYEEYLEDARFNEYVKKYFDQKEQVISTTKLTYQLLLILPQER
ncbi:class I SAM-dependent methyltransferase [Enterococcus ratti]|uniref:Methyltransferase domain-containing protein n=1 Tax=Enterococcus ratti TaxID=150033 RepID=A0A1L8WL72_9ENTE|nr:class I SAM-dependent methyltransferase [Enterococcus ratti]OJG81770.1 hypothetical protein RV14_GL002313 [Enterococcus ratti]